MTTYSGVIGKNLAEVRTQSHSLYRLNIVLLASGVFMALIYIFSANFVVAQKYGVNMRKSQLSALTAQAGYLNNEYNSDQDMETLLLFAKKSGMVEAKDADSILQDRDFALSP